MTVHEYEDSRYMSGRGKIHCGLTRQLRQTFFSSLKPLIMKYEMASARH